VRKLVDYNLPAGKAGIAGLQDYIIKLTMILNNISLTTLTVVVLQI
jgi:hypothetical protein